MYRQGYRRRTHHKLYTIIICTVVVLAGASFAVAHYFLKSNTQISNSPAVDTQVTVPEDNTKHFKESTFSINLPSDWKPIDVAKIPVPTPTFAWENETDNPGVEQLYVYVDVLPTNMAVNRALPIQSNGNKLVVAGSVSDNCTSFTGSGPNSSATGYVAAKWDGVNFLCDVSNYERDVVGTSSPQAINSVTVTGSKGGTHKYFFVYTDNSAEPNYTIFTDALQSFEAN